MFDWRDYLDLATRVGQRWGDEAAQRSAISRAYYAVYHRASQYVRAEGLIPAHVDLTHKKVWNVIRTTGDPKRREAGNRGDRLKIVRIRADYDNPFPGDLEKSRRDALLEAQDLLDLIDSL